MACVAVISLMRTIELEFFQSNSRLNFEDSQHIIKSLHEMLAFLQTFLDESEKKADINEKLKDLTAKIGQVILKAEYDIEAELAEIHRQRLDQTLRRVVQDIEQLIENAHSLTRDLQTESLETETESASSSGPLSSQQASKIEDTVVGHAAELEEFRAQLLHSSNEQRQVMPIVGMGGIGKTTFARRIYDDSAVRSHFDCCGWATMSQEHNQRQVLLELCRCVIPMRDDVNTQNDGELAQHLRRGLLGRRYLIVVDDMWTAEAWDDVQRCFPDENTSSRILLTTRLKEVADYACCGKFKLCYDMRCLYPDESWNLFYQKLLVKECLNQEFKTVGKKIVQKCQGLPLAVVVLAGHLSTNMVIDEWKNVESTLNSTVNLDLSEQFSRILTLSYNNLPCHLKGCFLYLGAFPEDSEIEIKKLIRLWIAEGFIKEASQMRLEELGEVYVHDLINRSLIRISGRSTDGKIKTCRMHDLLHDLCAGKAKMENLLCTEDNGTDGHVVHSDDHRWLSLKVASPRFHLGIALNKSRSILCFDMYAFFDHDWYLRVYSFKMLRVLDLTVIDYKGSIPHDIMDVVLLRYLALASTRLLSSIPLQKNQNLQTLIVCEDINGAGALPLGIWDLPQLRHLEFYHQLSIYTPKVVQVNLQTIYWLQSFQCTKQVFLRIPNVKELGIIARGCRCHRCLDNLNCLVQLEKLKVQGTYCPIKLPTNADAFPQNLKKITFSKTLLPWEAMSIISMLPNLEVLKLKNHACLGQEWELTEDDGFRRLKFLLISVTDLKHWSADDVEYPFPVLERLVLRNCFELKEMPSWIESVNMLKSIQLEHCYASLVSSVRMIEEEQRECYGEEYAFEILEFHTRSEELSEKDDQKNGEVFKEQSYEEELVRGIACVVQSRRIEARNLWIAWVEDLRYWSWTWDSGYEVAELLQVCWLDIRGTVDTRCLHKMTYYSAYLLFKTKSRHYGLHLAHSALRYVNDNNSYREKQLFLTRSGDSGEFPHRRDDGWMEIKLGEFAVSNGNEGDVEIRLWSTANQYWKSGLIVRAIEVRPN